MAAKAILGEMKIVDMGGSLVVLFKNKSQWTKIEERRFHKTGTTTITIDERPFRGYTHDTLFGMGRNPLRPLFMHPDDQQKIVDAKNAMIDNAHQKLRAKQQDLIDKVGATGFVQPKI